MLSLSLAVSSGPPSLGLPYYHPLNIPSFQLFVLAIFVAVITSQLTTASILATPPTVKDLRGLRIGIQTTLLQPFLLSVQVAAIPVVYNTLEDAVKLIYTTNPDNLDGYLTTTEIVQFFNQKYGAGRFVETTPFLTSNESPDQKAFVLSKVRTSQL